MIRHNSYAVIIMVTWLQLLLRTCMYQGTDFFLVMINESPQVQKQPGAK